MRGTPRIAAAFAGLASAGLVAAALASGAGGGSAARVELQVAPRGPGHVSASPAGVDLQDDATPVGQPCFLNSGEGSCRWGYEQGSTVTLAASADSGGTFLGWSTPDCPGTGSCTVTLDAELTSVVALFSPLRLGVIMSHGGAGSVSTDPPGRECRRKLDGADQCYEFPPHTRVTVTVEGSDFKGWNPGCEPTTSRTCTIAVEDDPTWVGARFDGDDPPQLPTTIKVQFRLRKSGNGGGRVSAPKLDCGSACSANFDYGQPLSLTATPDSGSVFAGWNGICSRTQTTCTFPVGPVTAITASFARDTPPSAPGGLNVTSTTGTSIGISWTASTDDAAVSGYRVYVDDAPAGDTTATQFTLAALRCGRRYDVAVDAVDASGNRSPKAALAVDTKPCPLAARIARVAVARAPGKRTIVLQLRVNRNTTARLRLVSHGRSVASGRYGVHPGTNVLRLGVPRRLAAGRYRLMISIVDPDGGTRVLSPRGVLLPPRR